MLKRTLSCVFILVLVLNLLPSGATAQTSRRAPDAVTYQENFSSTQYKSYTENAVWNTTIRQAGLLKQSGTAHREPVIAADRSGGAYVAWSDLRNNQANGNWDVYAQHLDANGNRLWPDDIRVNSDITTFHQAMPLIAVDSAGNALVGWRDHRFEAGGIYVQKLTASGVKLWLNDLRINSANSYRIGWGMTSWGMSLDPQDRLWLVWQGAFNHDWANAGLFYQVMDAAGSLVFPLEIKVNTLPFYYPGRVDDTTLGIGTGPQGDAVIVWTSLSTGLAQIMAQRVDLLGGHSWSSEVRVDHLTQGEQQGSPSVALNAQDEAMVVWRQGPPDPPVDLLSSTILVQKLAANGNRAWTSEKRVNQNTDHAFRGHPQAVSVSGDRVLVVWDDSRRGYGTIDSMAQLMDSSGTRLWTEEDRRINPTDWDAWNLKPMASVWQDTLWLTWNTDEDAFIRPVDLDSFSNVWPVPVVANRTEGRLSQIDSGITRLDNTIALVAWQSNRQNTNDIYVQLINLAGIPGWNQPLLISDRQTLRKRYHLQLASNADGTTLVAWQDDDGGIYGQAVDRQGNRLWAKETLLSSFGKLAYNPSVDVFADGSFLLTWIEPRTSSSNLWDIAARRITQEGTAVWAANLRVNQGDYMLGEIDMRSRPKNSIDANDHFVVAWFGNNGGSSDYYIRRFSSGGVPDWPTDLAVGAAMGITPYTISGHFDNTLITVKAGSPIYVAMAAEQNGQNGIVIQAISIGGQLVWPVNVWGKSITYPAFHGNPSIVDKTGGGIYVGWDDESGNRTIYVQAVEPDGQVTQAPGTVNPSQSWPLHPVFTEAMDGQYLTAWNDDRYGDSNIYVQKFDETSARLWSQDLSLNNFELYYRPSGRVVSRSVDATGEAIPRATLTTVQTLNGGMIQYFLSNNGGTTWEEVIPGVRHTFQSTGSDLRWKAIFYASTDFSSTPILSSLRIRYVDNPLEDIYEPDDTCGEAQPISSDGQVQQHNFYQPADEDWSVFTPTAGLTYVVQTSNVQDRADTLIDIYIGCKEEKLGSAEPSLGKDFSYVFTARDSRPIYLQVYNSDPAVYGAGTGYDLSLRMNVGSPVALIVAGHKKSDLNIDLNPNIHHMGDDAYKTLLEMGVHKENIRYLVLSTPRDVDGNGQIDDIAGDPTPANIQQGIQEWASTQGVKQGVPFYIYLVDHGEKDIFYADGSSQQDQISPDMINNWLTNLENRTRADQIVVIIESCHSGSFIQANPDLTGTISKQNRVIITSTNAENDSYTSSEGGFFSDAFWTEIRQNKNLYDAYQSAAMAVNQIRSIGVQIPWLDDDGDGVANPDKDGMLAKSMGFGRLGGGDVPLIDQLSVQANAGQLAIHVRVQDDQQVKRVWGLVFPPGYTPPAPNPDGSLPPLNVPVVYLQPDNAGGFSVTYSGAAQTGFYRVVLYALDNEDNQAMPVSKAVCSGCSFQYIPALRR